MSNTTAISFWEFISNYEIEIPIIQRDYAQGRKDKGVLRKKFLLSLKGALDDPENSSLKLDFIYGANSNNKFTPIDGQQRLTTLWLLHWYIAMRAGKLKEAQKILEKFSYETRVSSREFCKCLCNPDNFKNYTGKDIVGYIRNCTWYYSDWNQDPTINSMLTMIGGTKEYDKLGYDYIDGLEELFCKCADFSGYWEKLTSNDCCPIKFYKLPLENFGLSDDLYIKMNARGKQLSAFENFKADMIGYIRECEEDKDFKQLLDPQKGLPLKLDTSWTDIFWMIKGKASHQIHEIFYAFFNRFFWNEFLISFFLVEKHGDINKNENYKYFNNDCFYAYDDFSNYRYSNGEIPISFFENLQKVLDRTYKYLNDEFKVNESKYKTFETAIQANWDNSFFFIPKYRLTEGKNIEKETEKGVKYLDITPINQVQRIAFFAICKYLKEGDIEETSFKQWMRVIWNLISGEDENGNQQIRSVDAIKEAIRFIDQLNSHDVYLSLCHKKNSNKSAFDKRCIEEIEKAKQILYGNIRETWQGREEVIIAAEKYAFFKGSISFLFTDGNGDINWGDFDQKWENVQEYFDENGVRDEYNKDVYLLRLYISKFTKWNEFWHFDYNNKPSTWRYLLTDKTRSSTNHSFIIDAPTDLSLFESNLELPNDEYTAMRMNIHNTLVKSSILVKASEIGARLNWRTEWNAYSLYPYNARRRDKIFIIGTRRNDILSILCDDNIITECLNRFERDNFFYGVDIPFKYNHTNFEWKSNNYVYFLLKKNDEYAHATDLSGKEICFIVTDDTTSDDFCKKLDNLIEQYNRDIASSDSHSDDVL